MEKSEKIDFVAHGHTNKVCRICKQMTTHIYGLTCLEGKVRVMYVCTCGYYVISGERVPLN